MPRYSIVVNEREYVVDGDAEMPLLWVLRDRLALHGTKYGCGVGACGACTVLEEGRAVRSCQIAMRDAARRRYTTIEGLSAAGTHACQMAWVAEDVAQCGFCQPGMIMEAVSLLGRTRQPSDADIDAAFASHVCRCGTYTRIRAAVHRAVQAREAE